MSNQIDPMVQKRVPSPGSAAYKAGRHIYNKNMLTISEHELFISINFGRYSTTKQATLERAIAHGWLERVKGGVALSAFARKFYDGLGKLDVPDLGNVTTPRQSNVYERPPISKRFIPNSRGLRLDIPKFSERPDGFRIYTVA